MAKWCFLLAKRIEARMDSFAERRAAFFESPPAPLLFAPPRGFRPAGRIAWASEAQNPHSASSLPPSSAQLAGLRYERRVKDWLAREFGHSFLSGPWWMYSDGGRRRYCQPDGTLRRGDSCTIVEIKLRWTALAWWQLQRLYLPVARALYPSSSFSLCAIVRSFDPAIPTPAPVRLIETLTEGESATAPDLVVLPWRG